MDKRTVTDLVKGPLRVLPTKVRRTYRGGRTIAQWHGNLDTPDGDIPEEWLASATSAVNPGFPLMEEEGLSVVSVPEGEQILLRDLIAACPGAMLGTDHMERYGARMGVLAKLIDSAERLSIQVHPDKGFAQKHFQSEYGKTECWHILATRKMNGQDPYLLMGFRPGVTRQEWLELFRRQDISAMQDCLNRVTPKPGDTWLIPGGLPHAIGPGCFLLEIQEPTDLTLRSERIRQDGIPIPDKLVFQGLDEAKLMDCFHYEPMDEDRLDKCLRLCHPPVTFPGGSIYLPLVTLEDTSCFSMDRVVCKEPLTCPASAFSILVVLSGHGTIRSGGGALSIHKGDQIFCPAAIGGFILESNDQNTLEAIWCHPPGVARHSPTVFLA